MFPDNLLEFLQVDIFIPRQFAFLALRHFNEFGSLFRSHGFSDFPRSLQELFDGDIIFPLAQLVKSLPDVFWRICFVDFGVNNIQEFFEVNALASSQSLRFFFWYLEV